MNIPRWLWFGYGIAAMAAFGQAVMDPTAHPTPDATIALIEGTIQSRNPVQSELSVGDKSGQFVTVKIDRQTRILDDKNHVVPLAELKEKDPIDLYYNVHSHHAVLIDRLQTIPEAILTPGKP